MQLKTAYDIGEIPRSEYPLPQEERETWLCLNGEWNLQKITADGEKRDCGKILVPFSPETIRSGIKQPFVLHAGEKLVYTRKVILSESFFKGRTTLRFGGVDSECEAFVNGVSVGKHTGGFTAFVFDITGAVQAGENEFVIVCADEATRNSGARGKQNDKRGGIWYTPQSGIWQTVWLESMPKDYIRGLKITPDAISSSVKIQAESDSEQEIIVYDDGKEIIRKKFHREIELCYPFEKWSPNTPKLYTFTLENGAGDKLKSYFGVRSFGKTKDSSGKARLTLNGKPFFFNGVLDQGYWSDGMLTYPSDKAVCDELETLKAMGFNTLRKHIKIEPMRWYYHCDRLGIVVWQDFVNGGGEYSFLHVAAFPFLGFKHKDSDYKYFARESESGRNAFKAESEETVEQLYNCPCIGLWTIFNEGWGQFDSALFTAWLKEKDPTRIIDSVSGWHDQGVGKTELKSLHTYYTPLKVPNDPRPVVLSEFGGYSMQTDGHVFDNEKEFGYKKFKTQETLVKAIEKLYLEKVKPLIKKGLCGCIYTQVSDVEEEINGFFTYDRKVLKVPVSAMSKINAEIDKESEKVK